MSLTSPVPDPYNGITFTALGKDCFYCGRRLSDPSVHWMGHTGEIYLHPPCVTEFTIRLFRDLHELACPDFYRKVRGQ